MSAGVSTPEELTRTAFRLFILIMCHGLSQLPKELRWSEAGMSAHRALLTANDFFFHEYDWNKVDLAIEALCKGLMPLAALEFDPFRLYVATSLSKRAVKNVSRSILARVGWPAHSRKVKPADTGEVILFPLAPELKE